MNINKVMIEATRAVKKGEIIKELAKKELDYNFITSIEELEHIQKACDVDKITRKEINVERLLQIDNCYNNILTERENLLSELNFLKNKEREIKQEIILALNKIHTITEQQQKRREYFEKVLEVACNG